MDGVILARVVIDRPVGEVFTSFADLENSVEFDPEVLRVERTPPGPVGVGTTFVIQEHVPPFGRVQVNRVVYTAVEPAGLISWVAEIGPLVLPGSVLFEGLGDRTRLSFRDDGRPRGWRRLLLPVLRRSGRRLWATRFADFKAWMERPQAEDDRFGRSGPGVGSGAADEE